MDPNIISSDRTSQRPLVAPRASGAPVKRMVAAGLGFELAPHWVPEASRTSTSSGAIPWYRASEYNGLYTGHCAKSSLLTQLKNDHELGFIRQPNPHENRTKTKGYACLLIRRFRTTKLLQCKGSKWVVLQQNQHVIKQISE